MLLRLLHAGEPLADTGGSGIVHHFYEIVDGSGLDRLVSSG
jgi:hypothetical protein